jgi:hypothetical protein
MDFIILERLYKECMYELKNISTNTFPDALQRSVVKYIFVENRTM